MSESKTVSLWNLLDRDLIIPSYQRPYEWNKSNVYILLDDIYNSYIANKDINLGSIILYKNSNGSFEIVDGQQRLITLSLVCKSISSIQKEIKLLDQKLLCISDTERRIIDNYKSIKDFLDRLEKYEGININSFGKYLKGKVFFYVLVSKDSNEAFQLFDGRNSKFKDLTPVDLLKAYHLGVLPKNISKTEKKHILEEWNININDNFDIDNSCNKIEFLYNNVLFNIYNWSLNKDIRNINKNDIYLYKGYCNNSDSENYSYVQYYKNNTMFQINKPFKAGKDFFTMTNEYIKKLDYIINTYNLYYKIGFNTNLYNYNLRFINILYYDCLLAFFDKFGNNIKSFYIDAIVDFVYKYSLLLRIKKEQVNKLILNNYVLRTKYNFFYECNNALKVEELLKLELEDIGNEPNKDKNLGEMRYSLWKKLNQ